MQKGEGTEQLQGSSPISDMEVGPVSNSDTDSEMEDLLYPTSREGGEPLVQERGRSRVRERRARGASSIRRGERESQWMEG